MEPGPDAKVFIHMQDGFSDASSDPSSCLKEIESKKTITMVSPNSNSWKQHLQSLPGHDEGNKNMVNFTKYCTKIVAIKISKLRDLVEDEDVIFLGNIKGKITLFHIPTNFGGTRARMTNKVACILGLGPEATAVLLNEDEICSSKRFKGATKEKIYKSSTKE